MTDAFSKYHPAVNFGFFAGAVGAGVVIQHPAYLLAGILAAGLYYVLLGGWKAVRRVGLMLPFSLLVAVINPLFNISGQQVLFSVFGRPYTAEALLYGGAVGGMLLVMLLWFGCYNAVMTGDKFTSLFGNVIPSISLLLVMVLRMVPNLMRKTRQILGARKAIGKGFGTSTREKLDDGMTALSAMTSWALEGSLVTADSMRCRGYGSAKRTSFMRYRMGMQDWCLAAVLTVLFVLVILAGTVGQMDAVYTPKIKIAPVSWGVLVYSIYLLIPAILHGKEAIQWHISRSRI